MSLLAFTNVLLISGILLLVGGLLEPLPRKAMTIAGSVSLMVAFLLMVAVTTMII